MSYHPPDCKCWGDRCGEMFYRAPVTRHQADEVSFGIATIVLASNPFNRIEDREAELRRTLRTR